MCRRRSVRSSSATALRLSSGARISPQTGEHGRVFTLTNRSGHACRLSGHPRLVFHHGPRRLRFQLRGGGGGYLPALRPRSVLLASGGRAYFLAAKYRCDGGIASPATTVRVTVAQVPRSVSSSVGPERQPAGPERLRSMVAPCVADLDADAQIVAAKPSQHGVGWAQHERDG
ncbi:MAG: DUF4232 domain-containing protein [Trebonia sp.]